MKCKICGKPYKVFRHQRIGPNQILIPGTVSMPDCDCASEREIFKMMTLMSIESLQGIVEEEPDLYSEKDIKGPYRG